jgi:hypothetical protein
MMMHKLANFKQCKLYLVSIIVTEIKLITLLIIIIIIIYSKKYDLLHGGVFDVSKYLIKCASF